MTAVELFKQRLIQRGIGFNIKDFEEAKEMEKEQLQTVWKAAEQNMRSQFSSSAYKHITFDEYYEALGSKKY